jgi:hypothetical protein
MYLCWASVERNSPGKRKLLTWRSYNQGKHGIFCHDYNCERLWEDEIFQQSWVNNMSPHKYQDTTWRRAIAQAISRRLPTATVRVRAQVKSYGICDGQSGTEADFLRAFWFPLPILIPLTSHSSIILGWYNRPNSSRRTKWTHSHPRARN